MPYNSNLHNRNSIRMQGYDYTQIGSYFITICTRHKECLLGEITDGKMKLSSLGEIVYCQWLQLPNRFSNIILDAFIIMPNHIHGIVIINGENPPRRGEAGDTRHNSSANNLISPASPDLPNREPLQLLKSNPCSPKNYKKPHGTIPGSVGAIIQNYKSLTSRKINTLFRAKTTTIWQRNFYEHIIRDEMDLDRIVAYIENNPISWSDDKYFS